MMRLLTRVQLAYLGLFVLVCAAVFAYQIWFVWPVERCNQQGGWWSAKYHECATPIPIWRFTGRLPGSPEAKPYARPATAPPLAIPPAPAKPA